jgi:catechol 2,3-dioxygenase-like lactoylglutathione lyase family enzyme
MSMFTHVMVGTNDPGKARVFYDAVFGALGIPGMQAPNGALWYGDPAERDAMFAVVTPRDEQPARHANGGTIGFKAQNAAQVDAWHAAGVANGGRDEGPPGPRDWGIPLYVAYLRDPDGNKLCALFMTGEPGEAS